MPTGWASARRGNLDSVLREELGKPIYFDVFAQSEFALGDNTRLSINGLYSRDRISLVTESEPEELEQSISQVDNTNVWMLLSHKWSSKLHSTTKLSTSAYGSIRNANTADASKLVGFVTDDRDIDIYALRHDMTYRINADMAVSAGMEVERQKGYYDYSAQAEYFEFYALLPTVPTAIDRAETRIANGDYLAFYVSSQFASHRKPGC